MVLISHCPSFFSSWKPLKNLKAFVIWSCWKLSHLILIWACNAWLLATRGHCNKVESRCFQEWEAGSWLKKYNETKQNPPSFLTGLGVRQCAVGYRPVVCFLLTWSAPRKAWHNQGSPGSPEPGEALTPRAPGVGLWQAPCAVRQEGSPPVPPTARPDLHLRRPFLAAVLRLDSLRMECVYVPHPSLSCNMELVTVLSPWSRTVFKRDDAGSSVLGL